MLPNLTDSQQAIVDSDDPTLIAYGGAGTGKTTAALYAARAEIEQRAAEHQKVLFLTFSRTAVAQILDRAGPVLKGLDDRVEIMTFHGFAYRMIMDFGQYAGFGPAPPPLVGEAAARLMDDSQPALRLDDLLPGCLRVLKNGFVKSLLVERWPMIICDEFQDTGDDHWRLIEFLAPPARLVLLADPNQLIYGFVPGVGAHRLAAAEGRHGSRVLELQPASYRDPSQILPAAAAAIRRREFLATEVAHAIERSRMAILSGVSFEDCGPRIDEAIADRRRQGDASFGVYIHGNGPAADLSAQLTSAGVNNVAVGFPEAYGQALSVMVECLRFTNSLCAWEHVEFQLGVLATSLIRSKDLPPLARMLCGDKPRPSALDERLANIENECNICQDPTNAIDLAAGIWTRLGLTFGNQQWDRAARMFTATATGLFNRTNQSWIDDTKVALDQAEAHSLVGSIEDARGSVQVMNLHQTKGREADATILVFRDGEYFGRDLEPYEESSRLLYVALTRARNHVTIVLGEEPHPLVQPLRQYATGSASP